MRYLFLFTCLHCSLFSVAQKKYKVLTVASYNLENLFNPADDPKKQDEDFTPTGNNRYTDQVYKEKLHNMAEVISQLGADVNPNGAAIVGLVEVEDSVALRDLVNQPQLKTRNYRFVWFYGPDVRGISTAMLYNPQYFTLLNAAPVHVPIDSIGTGRPTRDILHVKGILAGDTMDILVNHWPSRSGGEDATRPLRKVAAATSRKIVDSLFATNANAKILIMGDFNDNPNDVSIKKILRAEDDKDEVNPGDIYNPWYKLFKKGRGTHYYDGWNMLDQIMLSGSFLKEQQEGWKYFKSVIFNKDFLNQIDPQKGEIPHRSFTIDGSWDKGYSDHYPIVVYLVKKVEAK